MVSACKSHIHLTSMLPSPHHMTQPNNTPVIAFDPGGETGFAALDKYGNVLVTMTLSIQELEGLLTFLDEIWSPGRLDVIVEQGPETGHHSPVTRRAERMILDIFPSAYHVQPTRWKSHPAYRKRVHIPRRLVTAHEHDAVRLGQWFIRTGEKSAKDTDSTRADSASPRHQRN